MKNYHSKKTNTCKIANKYEKNKKQQYCFNCEEAMLFKDEDGNITGSMCFHLLDEKF